MNTPAQTFRQNIIAALKNNVVCRILWLCMPSYLWTTETKEVATIVAQVKPKGFFSQLKVKTSRGVFLIWVNLPTYYGAKQGNAIAVRLWQSRHKPYLFKVKRAKCNSTPPLRLL